MGFDEGRIIFNSDNGIYYSGQTVHGKLIFDQEKEKTFRGIYVKLKGFCYVHWRTSHTRTVNGKTETYYVDHTSREEYINIKSYLIGGPSGECTISTGHYEYPFQLTLPGTCPSSFEGEHGHVRYEVKAVVDRAFKMDQEKKAVVRVIAPLDLNTEPGAKEPIQIKFDETYYCCCSRSGSVTAVAKMPYAGYIPGQNIPIEMSCDNNGSVTIDSITITLKKDTKFHAQGTKSQTDEVAQLELGEVAAGASRSFAVELLVPYVDTPNLRHCRYIDVDYRIKVELSPDGCHTDSSESRGIVIGTVPIAGSSYPAGGQDGAAQQNVPVVNQPLSRYPGTSSPYPGGRSPYPANAYPSNTPYPGPVVTPYPPTNAPYPNGNEHPPPPPPYSVNPSENASYPYGPTQYPPSQTTSEKTPYPGGPTVTPYPTSNSPYPPSNTPYPTSNSPYPPTSNVPYQTSNSPYPPTNSPYPPSNTPYPTSNAPYPTSSSPFPPPSAATATDQQPASTGLRTGTFGFIGAPGPVGDNKSTMPQLPEGAMPYPMSPSPFAAASAPEPSTPDDEKK